MIEYELKLPPMGEGVMEATVTGWAKNEGDFVQEDDVIIEIATDKVDSDVPSPVSGKIIKKLKNINDICKIGEPFAILEIEGKADSNLDENKEEVIISNHSSESLEKEIITEIEKPLLHNTSLEKDIHFSKDRFYSPLVKAICIKENISQEELSAIKGTGINNRITKDDMFLYLKNRKNDNLNHTSATKNIVSDVSSVSNNHSYETEEVIEMDRMRKLIAEHMIASKQISPHVTSFIEADVTNIVQWRNKIKDAFFKKEGEKITFTPLFIQAIVKAIKDYPMINISVEGNNIIKKKNINIGVATALVNGNLIVPVIKNADQLSLTGLTKATNDLAKRARNNNLKPEEIKGGTYTITNLGSFGNIAGTPIINQPEVAILAIGAIVKKPAVIETPQGDLLGIRHKMILSHTYDHRVVDGALGGMFVKRVCEYLENFDINTLI